MSDIENQSSTASEPSTAVAEDSAGDCGAGYLRLAEMMGSFPDIAIFRRFGGLSALNLLYYQAELVYLERELVYLSQKDAHSSDGDRRKYQRDWWLLHQATQAQECVESRNNQYKKFLQIRELLERYRMVLSQGPLELLLTALSRQGPPRATRAAEDRKSRQNRHHLPEKLDAPERYGRCLAVQP